MRAVVLIINQLGAQNAHPVQDALLEWALRIPAATNRGGLCDNSRRYLRFSP